jgi:hypothetical protein
VVVDMAINILGKTNIELGPKMTDLVNNFKKTQFQTLNFIEKTSPIYDGGDQGIEDYVVF